MAGCGPGYATPLDAMKGPKEEIIYIVCIQPEPDKTKKPDYLATVDVDPTSPTFCQIIHRTYMKYVGDELHHSGWNICSSCHGDCTAKRNKLVLPCLGSDRIYFIDTEKNPRAPEIDKVVEPSDVYKYNVATLHTTHCLPSGQVMISTLGDVHGNGKGDFILIDAKTCEVKGTWTNGPTAKFGYDFWYQPYWDVMVASEWGAPRVFKRGFQPIDPLDTEVYGRSINFYSWSKRTLLKSIDLGMDGIAPLEIRFLHNPKESQGYVGCCLNSVVFRFYRKSNGEWDAHKVIEVPPKKITGWIQDEIKGMTTDILISLDDKYLYMSNWLHGDVRQYDITDREHPKLTGQVFLGGSILSDSQLKVIEDKELKSQPQPVTVKGTRLHGAPQMLQLSLDGKRLYVSSSLFSPWDKQFYPETVQKGSWIVKLDVDTENGGLSVDNNFLVNFGNEPDGPVFAHEMRYPGGDCTSDIWMV